MSLKSKLSSQTSIIRLKRELYTELQILGKGPNEFLFSRLVLENGELRTVE